MTLKKAIEITMHIAQMKTLNNRHDECQALKLLLEAGKAVIDERANNYTTPIPTLPGETE